MADRSFVIRIGVQDQATKAIERIGRIADIAIGNVAADAFRMASRQLERFAEHTFQVARQTSGPFAAAFKELEKNSKGATDQFAEALAPAMTIIAKGLSDAAAETAKWIKENKTFLQLKIGDALAELALVAIPALATGLEMASDAWATFQKVAATGQKVLAHAQAEFALKNLEIIRAGIAEMERGVDVEGRKLVRTSESVKKLEELKAREKELSLEYRMQTKAFFDADQAQARASRTQEERQRSIEEFHNKITAAVHRGKQALREFAGVQRDALDPKFQTFHAKALAENAEQEQKAAGFKRKLAEDNARHIAEIEGKFKDQTARITESASDRQERSLSELQDRGAQYAANAQAYAGIASSAISDSFAMALRSGEDWGAGIAQIMGNATIDAITYYINTSQAAAIAAAIKSGEAAAVTPIVGPILAIAAAATVGGIMKGLLAQITVKKRHGGLIPGYDGGGDSVPAMLSPGEAVLTRGQTQAILGGKAALVGAGGGGGNVTNVYVQPQYYSFVPDSRTSFRRKVRDDLIPAITDTTGLSRSGVRSLRVAS